MVATDGPHERLKRSGPVVPDKGRADEAKWHRGGNQQMSSGVHLGQNPMVGRGQSSVLGSFVRGRDAEVTGL